MGDPNAGRPKAAAPRTYVLFRIAPAGFLARISSLQFTLDEEENATLVEDFPPVLSRAV
jgi:hypothetical protein